MGAPAKGGGRQSVVRRLYSAVIDPKGLYPAQAERLVWSLIELAAVDPGSIVMHVVDRVPTSVERCFEERGVHLARIDSFRGHAHSNKINQVPNLVNLASQLGCEEVVLLDCDVMVLNEPPSASGGILAKMVDEPNPPVETIAEIFRVAGVEFRPGKSSPECRETVWANANGGVYVIDVRWLPLLGGAWAQWAHWCVDHVSLFGDKDMFIDQISFALAVASEGLPFTEMDLSFNFPIGKIAHAEPGKTIDVLHYHRQVDSDGRLIVPDGPEELRRVIDGLNQKLDHSGMLVRWASLC